MSDIKDTKDEKVEKKRVGRPKKEKSIDDTNIRNGISTEPKIENNIIEFIYDTPLFLKKIFNYFKQMNVQEIKMEFLAKVVKISAVDHLGKNYVLLSIDAYKLSHYYCKYNHIVVLNLQNMDKILQKIDKSHNLIKIVSKEDSFRQHLFITFINNTMNNHDINTITIIDKPSQDIDSVFAALDYNNYPLKFTLPDKYFKKLINDISRFSSKFTIQRFKNIPLQFPYNTEGKTIEVSHIFTDESACNIISTIEKGDIFDTSVNIHYIKALSSSLISDNIDFFVDKEKKIVFKSSIDNGTLELITCCEIISYN